MVRGRAPRTGFSTLPRLARPSAAGRSRGESIVAKMSGGRAVVESLRAEGMRYVYGIVGSCMIEILDDMYDRRDLGLRAPIDQPMQRHVIALAHALGKKKRSGRDDSGRRRVLSEPTLNDLMIGTGRLEP